MERREQRIENRDQRTGNKVIRDRVIRGVFDPRIEKKTNAPAIIFD